MRSACSLPADVCGGGREEAVSIQLGQPYSEGIRHVIQPLPGRMPGGRAQPALTVERELTAGCLLTPWICLPRRAAPIRSSGQKAPGSDSEHIHVQKQLKMEELRNIRLQPTQARAGSIYSAMHNPPRGLIGCRLACDVVFLKYQASFAQCSLQEYFSHRRWEISSHAHTHTSLHLGE